MDAIGKSGNKTREKQRNSVLVNTVALIINEKKGQGKTYKHLGVLEVIESGFWYQVGEQ
jgi:hypothetical protein